jgi:D-alanyl-lipoteichoic acid acyltransferase DltB (MBOAT superfamily)
MVFSSVTFLFYFLPFFFASYYLAPSIRLKNCVGLVYSLLFYAWGEPLYVLLLLGSTALNAVLAIWMDRFLDWRRRSILRLAVILNIGVLAAFKYSDFLVANLNHLLSPVGLEIPAPGIPLPLGISFFTFHLLSYIIDVYRQQFPAERNAIAVATYVTLFPQLVAGPIIRYKTIAKQLRRRRHSLGFASAGARMFVIGLAQKVLLADQLGPVAGSVFDHTARPTIIEAWTGLLAYTIQIYFDFAGYSNMAIGLGLCLGFKFPRNFRDPYVAQSITEFWRRWHISLSSYLRDYLYIPLGGSRASTWQTYRNLAVVFLVCGLWHGASWTFVLWGAWHGAFLVAERAFLARALLSVSAPLRSAYALLTVMGGWVLFRASDLTVASAMFGGLVGKNGMSSAGFEFRAALEGPAAIALAAGCLLSVLPFWPRLRPRGRSSLAALDTAWTFALLGLSMVSVGGGTYSPFLYFRF